MYYNTRSIENKRLINRELRVKAALYPTLLFVSAELII